MNEPAPHGIRPLACVQPAGNPREGPLKTAPGRATTDLARTAAAEGRQLVIAAGGDGTVNEVAHGLADTETVLGLMPLGSVMNVARTLWVPRDLALAARPIAEGKVLAMGLGRIGDRFFLETAGVGLDAGLFGDFDRLEGGASQLGVLRAVLRFLRQLDPVSVLLGVP